MEVCEPTFSSCNKNVDPSKIDNYWESDINNYIPMKTCIIDYLRHLDLHLGEIEEMIA